MALPQITSNAMLLSTCLVLSGCFSQIALQAPGSYEENVPVRSVQNIKLYDSTVDPKFHFIAASIYGDDKVSSERGLDFTTAADVSLNKEFEWSSISDPGSDYRLVSDVPIVSVGCDGSQCKSENYVALCKEQSYPLSGVLLRCDSSKLVLISKYLQFPKTLSIKKRHWWGYPISVSLLPFAFVADIVCSPVQIMWGVSPWKKHPSPCGGSC